MSEPFSIRVHVRYAECDMQGHVFNGHYLTWFDMAHTGLLTKAFERSYREMVASGIDVVVAEAGIRFLAPARFEEELEIAVEFDRPTDSSLTSRYTVRRQGTVITTGFLRHVCVDARAMTKVPWPADLRAALEPFVTQAGAATDESRVPAEGAS